MDPVEQAALALVGIQRVLRFAREQGLALEILGPVMIDQAAKLLVPLAGRAETAEHLRQVADGVEAGDYGPPPVEGGATLQ